jgi:hypothetical protein
MGSSFGRRFSRDHVSASTVIVAPAGLIGNPGAATAEAG